MLQVGSRVESAKPFFDDGRTLRGRITEIFTPRPGKRSKCPPKSHYWVVWSDGVAWLVRQTFPDSDHMTGVDHAIGQAPGCSGAFVYLPEPQGEPRKIKLT